MTDTFTEHGASLDSPAENGAAVTPHNTNDLANATRGLCFAAAGALKVDMVGGTTVTFADGALAAGVVHPLRVTRVYATGTDATGIIALW